MLFTLQGSGKTTVARMLAEILKDSGARSKGTFVETSAQKLKTKDLKSFVVSLVQLKTEFYLLMKLMILTLRETSKESR